jgi:hypothetical protein
MSHTDVISVMGFMHATQTIGRRIRHTRYKNTQRLCSCLQVCDHTLRLTSTKLLYIDPLSLQQHHQNDEIMQILYWQATGQWYGASKPG